MKKSATGSQQQKLTSRIRFQLGGPWYVQLRLYTKKIPHELGAKLTDNGHESYSSVINVKGKDRI
jgi:hypothetical protein